MAFVQNFATARRVFFSLSLRSLSSYTGHPLKTQKTALGTTPLSSVVASYLAERKPLEAYKLFDQMVRSANPKFDPKTSNSLLATLSSEGHINLSQHVFEIMLSRNISFSTAGFCVFINRFCRDSKMDQVLFLLNRMQERMEEINGSVVAVMVVNGLCHVSRVIDAWLILEELRGRNCKPDFIAYQAIVEAFRELGRAEEARNVLKQKRKLGVAPRLNDYKELIIDLIAEKRLQEANELGELIMKGDFPIDDETLNALIRSVSEVYADSAISFCKYLLGKERFPTRSTFYNLSRNLIRGGKIDEMWNIFDILSSKDFFVDVESYNTMVSIFCEAGNVKEAYGVLKEMRKKGLGPDIFSYNCLMEALCRQDLLRPAKRLWDEMFKNDRCGDLQTYNILIKKLSKVGQVEEAQQLFYHMLEKGVHPDNNTYTSLLRGLCQESKIKEAYDIVLRSIEQDKVLFRSSLSTLVLSLCKQGNFFAALEFMQSRPCADLDDSNSHVILLKNLADAGAIDMAINHIKWVRADNPLKLQSISSGLLQSLSFSLKMEPTLKLLHAMKEIGVAFESDSWINLDRETERSE